MIRLKDLLFESDASEEAKKLGLVHKAGGNYASSKGGPTVARSIKGKLVKVGKKDIPSKKSKQPEESEVTFNVDDEYMESPFGQYYEKDRPGNAYEGGDGGTGSGMDLKAVFEWLEETNEKSRLAQHSDSTMKKIRDLIEQTNPDEELKIWGLAGQAPLIPNATDKTYRAQAQYSWLAEGQIERYTMTNGKRLPAEALRDSFKQIKLREESEGKRNGRKQLEEWRRSRPIEDQAEMLMLQNKWQQGGQSKQPLQYQKERNQTLNRIIKDGQSGPAKTKLVHDKMERGMRITAEDVPQFLANFKVGESTVMQPSGWTQRSEYSKMWSTANTHEAVGVILKMSPQESNGEVVGLQLSGLADVAGWGCQYGKDVYDEYKLDAKDEHETFVQHSIDGWTPTFESELEIIRPGFVAQKTTKIVKHLFLWRPNLQSGSEAFRKPRISIIYEISMVDMGEVPKEQIREGKITKSVVRKILDKYTNNSVIQGTKKKKKVKESALKLMDLIHESAASEQAKKKGLVHLGGAYYAKTKGGPAVARSTGGKLVAMSKKDIKAKKSKKITKNPAKSKKPSDKSKLNKLIKQLTKYTSVKKQPVWLKQELVKGEELKVYTESIVIYGPDLAGPASAEHKATVAAHREMLGDETYDHTVADPKLVTARRASYKQHNTFLTRLNKRAGALAKYMAFAGSWQDGGWGYDFRKMQPGAAVNRGKYVNDLIEGKMTGGKPPKITLPHGEMTRGMTLDPDEIDVEEFFENFAIGENVTLPPCGWSLYPPRARTFNQSDHTRLGVVMSIKGKEATGLALSDKARWTKAKKMSETDLHASLEKSDKQDLFHMGLSHHDVKFEIKSAISHGKVEYLDRECEVITPGWMQYRVSSVKKTVFVQPAVESSNIVIQRDMHLQVFYEIELEEVGPTGDPDLIREAKIKKVSKAALKALYRYVSGSFKDGGSKK